MTTLSDIGADAMRALVPHLRELLGQCTIGVRVVDGELEAHVALPEPLTAASVIVPHERINLESDAVEALRAKVNALLTSLDGLDP